LVRSPMTRNVEAADGAGVAEEKDTKKSAGEMLNLNSAVQINRG